jgi:hypothetical protein
MRRFRLRCEREMPVTSVRRRQKPRRYTFKFSDASALRDFARRQRVPPHDHPLRRSRLERWVLGRYLLARDAARGLGFPVTAAHALGNQSPDFVVNSRSSGAEGQEITQATTRKYQAKLKKVENVPGLAPISLGNGMGWAGRQAETYWCRQILRAVRRKLPKMSGYEPLTAQHLLIYDDMETAAVNYSEALQRLRPRLVRLLKQGPVGFATISILTVSNSVLYDVAGRYQRMTVPLNLSSRPTLTARHRNAVRELSDCARRR